MDTPNDAARDHTTTEERMDVFDNLSAPLDTPPPRMAPLPTREDWQPLESPAYNRLVKEWESRLPAPTAIPVRGGIDVTHPIIARLTGRPALEAVARGCIALLVVGASVAAALLLVLGHGVRMVATAHPDGTVEEVVVPISDDPLAMLVVGSLVTLAATVATHYFKATD